MESLPGYDAWKTAAPPERKGTYVAVTFFVPDEDEGDAENTIKELIHNGKSGQYRDYYRHVTYEVDTVFPA